MYVYLPLGAVMVTTLWVGSVVGVDSEDDDDDDEEEDDIDCAAGGGGRGCVCCCGSSAGDLLAAGSVAKFGLSRSFLTGGSATASGGGGGDSFGSASTVDRDGGRGEGCCWYSIFTSHLIVMSFAALVALSSFVVHSLSSPAVRK